MIAPAFAPTHRVVQTPALWHPDRAAPRDGFAVVLFRRTIHLPRATRRTRLWVSASQRFILYLNGRLLARGPSRSDPLRWGVTAVDLPPLPAGRHTLAACVVHFGEHAGIGQMGGPAFFLLAADDARVHDQVSTAQPWRCWHDRSRTPLDDHAWAKRPYYVVGCGERVEAAEAAWGWEQPRFNDRAWPTAAVICPHAHDPWGNLPLGCVLRPDPLPAMDETPARLARVAEAPADVLRPAEAWLAGRGPLRIGPKRQVRLVLDRGTITNAYPLLTVSGGRGSTIRVVGAEAPYLGEGRAKAHRDQSVGHKLWGHLDEYRPDGGRRRTFTTLWFRSFRYQELTIRTGREPLVLDDFALSETGFPLRQRADFQPAGPLAADLGRAWDVSWRTIQLCAHETFFDCPHYEQAQFPGDTRVQAVYHYLVANDDRLARKAIDDFHASRLPGGLTQCRFPSRRVQILPTFALYWVGMLEDFRIFRGDGEFLQPYLPAAREVLAWFDRHRRPDGLLGFIDGAPFMDWTPAFSCGNAPQDQDGGSALLTLLYASAAGWMANLEAACGFAELAPRWAALAGDLARAVRRRCWCPRRRLLADTPRKATFSVHAQVQATLAEAWPAAAGRAAIARALADDTVTQPGTLYFRYYVAQALRQAGRPGAILDLLPAWQRCLDGTGLTTWPESDRGPRSDCHAWSVTPAIEALMGVLGVQPDPRHAGFGGVVFAPALGNLKEAAGHIPTPRGTITVGLTRLPGGRVAAELDAPVPVRTPGVRRVLRPGRHRLRL